MKNLDLDGKKTVFNNGIIMTILRLYIYLLLFVILCACQAKQKPVNTKLFTVDEQTLPADTVVTSVVSYNNHLICLLENHKIFVLDTSFHPVDSLTNKFSKLAPFFLETLNDTVLIETSNQLYFLDSNFNLKKYNRQPLKYRFPDLVDSTYYVYSCGVGEFGGAVFFWNQETNKTYSYPATDVQQVLKFKDTYVVSSFLAHLGGLSDYLFIKDPTQLYELKDERQKRHCNWYVEDSIKGIKQFDTVTPPGVRYYADPFTSRTLTTFPYKNELYSIYCTDSATILARHENNKLTAVDTLLKQRLYFHEAKTHLFSGGSATAYRATWAIGGEGNSWTPFQNTGLIYIHNNRISLLEFQTPHMEPKTNGETQ